MVIPPAGKLSRAELAIEVNRVEAGVGRYLDGRLRRQAGPAEDLAILSYFVAGEGLRIPGRRDVRAEPQGTVILGEDLAGHCQLGAIAFSKDEPEALAVHESPF